MTQRENQFHKKVTWVTFLFSILVVCVHSYNVPLFTNEITKGFGGFLWAFEEFFSNDLGQIAVPGFFMISAYLFYRNFSWNKLLTKWKSRIRSIVIPYVVWNTLYFLIYGILTNVTVLSETTNKEPVVLSLMSWVDAVLNFRYNSVFWYLQQLIILIALAPLLFALLKHKVVGVLTLGVIVTLVMNQFSLPILNMDALLYYTIASFAALHLKDLIEGNPTSLRGLLGFIIVAIAYCFHLMAESTMAVPYIILYRLLTPIGFWFFFDGIPKVQVRGWMENSFFLYSIHFLIARTMNKLGSYILPNNQLFGFTLYLIIPMIVTIIAFYLALFLKLYMKGTWNLLSGNRA